MLQPAGPDLARRWLAALLVVPREERQLLVERVEATIAQTYTREAPALADPTLADPTLDEPVGRRQIDAAVEPDLEIKGSRGRRAEKSVEPPALRIVGVPRQAGPRARRSARA